VQLAKRGETSRLAKVIGDIYKMADYKLLHTDPNTSHHDSGGATCVLVPRVLRIGLYQRAVAGYWLIEAGVHSFCSHVEHVHVHLLHQQCPS
jgi:hypothetical protein